MISKYWICFTLWICISFGVAGADTIRYCDGHDFTVIGKFHNEKNYARFPGRYEGVLRPEVWQIGQRSTGISIIFRTNASDIAVKWTMAGGYNPAGTAGAKGVDLYVYLEGAWRYIQTGQHKDKTTEAVLLSGEKPVFREYLLNLPLNVPTESLFIGVNASASITKPESPFFTKKPIVHYGSSITQAAAVSRPGMAYTNILSRWLDRSYINLGFSGQETFDESVGQAMCEIDAALYIIDCNPNTDETLIYERAIKLVQQLKKCRPQVPVLLVENFNYAIGYFYHGYPSGDKKEIFNAKQVELRKAFESLKKMGVSGIFYQKGDDLIGKDQEATVDGAHPNDLGTFRFAETLLPTIKQLMVDN